MGDRSSEPQRHLSWFCDCWISTGLTPGLRFSFAFQFPLLVVRARRIHPGLLQGYNGSHSDLSRSTQYLSARFLGEISKVLLHESLKGSGIQERKLISSMNKPWFSPWPCLYPSRYLSMSMCSPEPLFYWEWQVRFRTIPTILRDYTWFGASGSLLVVLG